MTSSISRSSSAVVSSAGRLLQQAGRIDQPADQSEPVDDLVERVGDLVLVGDVGGDEDRVLVGEGGLGRGERGLVGIEHGDRPAIVQQPFGDRQADARCAAGDDRRMLHLMRSRIET